MDGAGPLAMFFYITLPHLGRAIAVVVMIEIDLPAAGVRRDLVTTTGGPGQASTNLAFFIYMKGLLEFDVGGASAGGVFAVVIANIVAIFLIRTIAKNIANEGSPCARILRRSSITHRPRLGRRARHVLPDLLDDPDQLQDRDRGGRHAARAVLHPDARELSRVVQRARRLLALRAWNSVIISVGATLLALLHRRPGGLRHGVLPDQADQGPAAVDALHQDDAGGRRAGADVPACRDIGAARYALGPHPRLYVHEPADRGLDALHLLQGGARARSSRPGRMDGAHASRSSGSCCCRWRCRASRRPRCCRSSCAGTRRSGAST